MGSNHERKVTPQHEHPHHSCRQGGAQAGTRGRRLRRRRRAAESRLNSEDASPEDENNEGPDSEVECNRTCQAHRPASLRLAPQTDRRRALGARRRRGSERARACVCEQGGCGVTWAHLGCSLQRERPPSAWPNIAEAERVMQLYERARTAVVRNI